MKIMRSIGAFLQSAWRFIFCFRKVFLAVPVVVVAILLARHNAVNLPSQVGLLLSSEGDYTYMISRRLAVYGPLLLTSLSLLLMAISRKVFYPWLISVITLVLPPLLLLLNQAF